MLADVKTYRLPDSVKQAFIDYAMAKGDAFNPYKTPYDANNPTEIRYELAHAFRQMLEAVSPDGNAEDYRQAQAILHELYEQRLGRGVDAFVIRNLPIDPELPATPQTKEQLPVGEKSTFVSEAIHEAILIAMGQRPFRQPGMQGGIEVTQVIPFPGSAHEQSNKGRGVLALHTEISSAPALQTPDTQSLLGLRGGKNVPVSQTVVTTLVPVEHIIGQLTEEEKKLLSMDMFHFSSGPAIENDKDRLSRLSPIISRDRHGRWQMRFHADPKRVRVMEEHPEADITAVEHFSLNGTPDERKEFLTKVQNALNRLHDLCDVEKHPELNASAIRIDPGVGLFWQNHRMLHGRGDTRTLLEHAVKGEQHSIDLVKKLYNGNRTPETLLDDFLLEKKAEQRTPQLTGAGRDPDARWVQRMRGKGTRLPALQKAPADAKVWEPGDQTFER